MAEEIKTEIVLPNDGGVEPVPHISIEVLDDAIRQLDEQLKRNENIRNQVQESLTKTQAQLNQANLNNALMNAQKAITIDYKKKITELLAAPKNV